jgi:hypothetical protein
VTAPVDIPPEDRDWTFVITEGCQECGFAPQSPPTTGPRLLATLPTWQQALRSNDVRRRPDPLTWSALEYGCHVRDTCRIFRARLELMLTEDDPRFANWDQNATATESDYAGQDPAAVLRDLLAEAQATAAAFDSVTEDQWPRPGRRSNGSRFTVATFAVYFLHDVEHHVHDISGPVNDIRRRP